MPPGLGYVPSPLYYPHLDMDPDFWGYDFYWQPPMPYQRLHLPKMDCMELEDRRIYLIELPGSKPSEIQLTLKDDTLEVLAPIHRHLHLRTQDPVIISDERNSGHWCRAIKVPHGLTKEEIRKVELKDGVLWIEVPNVTEEMATKKVGVEWVV